MRDSVLSSNDSNGTGSAIAASGVGTVLLSGSAATANLGGVAVAQTADAGGIKLVKSSVSNNGPGVSALVDAEGAA